MFLDTGEPEYQPDHAVSALFRHRRWNVFDSCEKVGHLYYFCTITYQCRKYLWKKCERCQHVGGAQPLEDAEEVT